MDEEQLMPSKWLSTLVLGLALLPCGTLFADEKGVANLKCPISGKAANKEVAAEYRGGVVYFCCAGCPGRFKEDLSKFSAKANHQLIASGQTEQTACPLTGRDTNASTATEIDGVSVVFCCGGCKSKVGKASDESRREMVYGDKAFEKAYEVKKAEKKEGFRTPSE